MSTTSRSEWRDELNQIESICETKGVDIDEINVVETTTDDGDRLINFRVYSEDGPKVQISKMPSVQTGEMTFRNDIQNRISALKRHIQGDGDPEPEDAPEPDNTSGQDDETDRRNSRRQRRSGDGQGPGSQLDRQIDDMESDIDSIESRLDDIEARIEEVEQKTEVLDGFQKMMQSDGNDE